MADKIEHITPERAQLYLKKNHPRNRPISRQNVESLANEFKEGRYILTNDAIAFDTEGRLIDGQHRLSAIIRANLTLAMRVVTDLDTRAFAVINTGKKRADHERLYMMGEDIDKQTTGLIRAVAGGADGPARMPLFQTRHLLHKLKEAIDFTKSHMPAGRSHQAVRAVVCRAWFTADRDRLEEFCKVIVNSQVSSNADGAAVLLVKKCGGFEWTNAKARAELFCYAQRALSLFLAHQTTGVLKPMTQDNFPLPFPLLPGTNGDAVE